MPDCRPQGRVSGRGDRAREMPRVSGSGRRWFRPCQAEPLGGLARSLRYLMMPALQRQGIEGRPLSHQFWAIALGLQRQRLPQVWSGLGGSAQRGRRLAQEQLQGPARHRFLGLPQAQPLAQKSTPLQACWGQVSILGRRRAFQAPVRLRVLRRLLARRVLRP